MGAVGAAGPVDELPVRSGGGGAAADLDHVAFPLDPLRCAVRVPVAFAVVVMALYQSNPNS
jgi:hypothetical protein